VKKSGTGDRVKKHPSEDIKFLTKARELAMSHKDVAVPAKEPELYSAKMWTLGVIMALEWAGYEVKEKKID
jgi:hypothetical protein